MRSKGKISLLPLKSVESMFSPGLGKSRLGKWEYRWLTVKNYARKLENSICKMVTND
jgi:hypothetical protein